MSTAAVTTACGACGKAGVALSLCARCKLVGYCSKECQRMHWPTHKVNGCVAPVAATATDAKVFAVSAGTSIDTGSWTIAQFKSSNVRTRELSELPFPINGVDHKTIGAALKSGAHARNKRDEIMWKLLATFEHEILPELDATAAAHESKAVAAAAAAATMTGGDKKAAPAQPELNATVFRDRLMADLMHWSAVVEAAEPTSTATLSTQTAAAAAAATAEAGGKKSKKKGAATAAASAAAAASECKCASMAGDIKSRWFVDAKTGTEHWPTAAAGAGGAVSYDLRRDKASEERLIGGAGACMTAVNTALNVNRKCGAATPECDAATADLMTAALMICSYDIGRLSLLENGLLDTILHHLTRRPAAIPIRTLRVVASVAAQFLIQPLPSLVKRLISADFRDRVVQVIVALWTAAAAVYKPAAPTATPAPVAHAFAIDRCAAVWPSAAIATIHVLTCPLYVQLMSARAAATDDAAAATSRGRKKGAAVAKKSGASDGTTDIHQNDSGHGGPTGAARHAKLLAEAILPFLLIAERFGSRLQSHAAIAACVTPTSELAGFIRRGLLQQPTPNFALTLAVDYRFTTAANASGGGAQLFASKLTIHADATAGVKCGENVDVHSYVDAASVNGCGTVHRCTKCYTAPATATVSSAAATDSVVKPLPVPFVPLPLLYNLAATLLAKK